MDGRRSCDINYCVISDTLLAYVRLSDGCVNSPIRQSSHLRRLTRLLNVIRVRGLNVLPSHGAWVIDTNPVIIIMLAS